MHNHTESIQAPTAPFKKALCIGFLFMGIELIGGWVANSLALITDALHLSTDVISLTLALLVIRVIALPKSKKMSYGYQRAEILGALTSSVFLLVLCVFLIYESIVRFMHPTQVNGEIVFIIAIIGLLVNLWMMVILRPVQHHDLNAKAAYLHVLGDLLASMGVVIGGLIIWLTAWNVIDPLITLLVSGILCYNSINIIRKSVNILMQAAPEGIDPSAIEKTLTAIPGVIALHDLHLWAVSSNCVALSAHVVAKFSPSLLQEIHHELADHYDIHYTTIQIEEPEKFDSRFCYDVKN